MRISSSSNSITAHVSYFAASRCALGISLSLAVLFFSACHSKEAAPTPSPAEVAFVEIHPERVAMPTELPGRTVAFLVADIRPQVNGLIKERLFREGDNVKAGELLYQIDKAPYQAAYEQAEAAVATAQAELQTAKANLPAVQFREQRLKGLAATHAVGQQDYDDAHAALLQAEATIAAREATVASSRAALESARINLSYTPIKSPISGRIGISNVTVGGLATAYQPTPLATVQQLDPIYIDVVQSSSEVLKLRQRLQSGKLKANGAVQSKVMVLLEDGTQYPIQGTLQFRDVTVDPTTGSMTLRIVCPNPEYALLPGMFVRARIEEGVNDQGILVPQQAVSRDAKGTPIAFVITNGSKVEQRILQLERPVGDKWLVSSGLSAGDRVIVEGLQKVRSGDTVRAVAFDKDTSPQKQNTQPLTGVRRGNV